MLYCTGSYIWYSPLWHGGAAPSRCARQGETHNYDPFFTHSLIQPYTPYIYTLILYFIHTYTLYYVYM